MRIFTKKTLQEYWKKQPACELQLLTWYKVVKNVQWNSFEDIKQVFNSAEHIGNQRVVFNIKGNDYRLIAKFNFTKGWVFVRFIGTHAEYDNIKDIKNI
ncbi:MAG: type II toxin-antitoxin system HigB family toxin [Bacteroidales bacterium]|nr:type II toxin-antitoxin system HigB family toxin [Bacteroidales bacterium]MCF8455554.1 type II toxin-antitoxin system HigB family toxin [Bacteroidales bacterium]